MKGKFILRIMSFGIGRNDFAIRAVRRLYSIRVTTSRRSLPGRSMSSIGPSEGARSPPSKIGVIIHLTGGDRGMGVGVHAMGRSRKNRMNSRISWGTLSFVLGMVIVQARGRVGHPGFSEED